MTTATAATTAAPSSAARYGAERISHKTLRHNALLREFGPTQLLALWDQTAFTVPPGPDYARKRWDLLSELVNQSLTAVGKEAVTRARIRSYTRELLQARAMTVAAGAARPARLDPAPVSAQTPAQGLAPAGAADPAPATEGPDDLTTAVEALAVSILTAALLGRPEGAPLPRGGAVSADALAIYRAVLAQVRGRP